MLKLTDSLFAAMVEKGEGDLDHSGIIREVARVSGAQVAA